MVAEPKTLLVFVSYSHHDADVVSPLVEMIRAFGTSVFRDRDSIPPGMKWRILIEQGIHSATMVAVFWCRHAAGSAEVRSEYNLAIESGKKLVPVLLDDTDLPAPLAQYQWIDFRGVTNHDSTGKAKSTNYGLVGPALLCLLLGGMKLENLYSWGCAHPVWAALCLLVLLAVGAIVVRDTVAIVSTGPEPRSHRELAKLLAKELLVRAGSH